MGDVSASYTARSALAVAMDGEGGSQSSSCGGGGGSVSSSSEECGLAEVRIENCSYDCSLLHEPPAGYNGSCEFIEENCGDEYELLNYLYFMDCLLGPSLRVRLQRSS